MELPVLPPKYYLDHFFELLDFLVENCSFLLSVEHHEFISEFRNLSEDAQCVYVRMTNRKACIFDRRQFAKYGEIAQPEAAVAELEKAGFCTLLHEDNKADLFSFLGKKELRDWLGREGLKIKLSASKADILQIAKNQSSDLRFENLQDAHQFLRQGRSASLDYLLFLYFGRIQKGLNLHTLRDLGIRRANHLRTTFRSRFRDREEAVLEYRLARQLEDLSDETSRDELVTLIERCEALKDLRYSARELKHALLLSAAEFLPECEIEARLRAWSSCETHPAREKRVRCLQKNGRMEECRALLEVMIQSPWCDEEALFAEDFLARKFTGRRKGYLSEALDAAREMTLSDFYFRRPEEGVIDALKKEGLECRFTENALWNSLFGLLFWDELFDSEASAIFNPFERSPIDLVGPEFYLAHQESLEQKLELLHEGGGVEKLLLRVVSQHYGKINDIFQWHTGILPSILDFVQLTRGCDLALVLRKMSQDYAFYHSGYPDLFVIRDGKPGFIEVKAEGDSLRSKQLSKLRLLREAGFQVEILKVKWRTDPQQTYVVVDLETTGGMSQFHRITEIGAVKMRDGEVIDEFQSLVNPGRPIPRHITQITGISNDMVAGAPRFEELAEAFQEFTRGSIFVAHNVRFDYGFLQREYQRLEQNFVRPQMCTCAGMRRIFPGLPSYSLKNLTDHFQISLDQHHRALCDARAAAELLKLMNSRRQPGPGLADQSENDHDAHV